MNDPKFNITQNDAMIWEDGWKGADDMQFSAQKGTNPSLNVFPFGRFSNWKSKNQSSKTILLLVVHLDYNALMEPSAVSLQRLKVRSAPLAQIGTTADLIGCSPFCYILWLEKQKWDKCPTCILFISCHFFCHWSCGHLRIENNSNVTFNVTSL